MILLSQKPFIDARFPDFPIPRLTGDVVFEPSHPEARVSETLCESAFIDTGAPYVVIPYLFHGRNQIHVHEELGEKPYRILSESGDPLMQRFAKVGLRFMVRLIGGERAFAPATFVRVSAYLLGQGVRPLNKVLIGKACIDEHFLLFLKRDIAFLDYLASPG